jgi:flagellar biosynthesis/type III secretory pathway M-ring protein FliF/YscJ
VGGAYLFRSAVQRSGDFSLDPADVLVVALVVVATALVALARRRTAQGGGDEPAQEREGEDRETADER